MTRYLPILGDDGQLIEGSFLAVWGFMHFPECEYSAKKFRTEMLEAGVACREPPASLKALLREMDSRRPRLRLMGDIPDLTVAFRSMGETASLNRVSKVMSLRARAKPRNGQGPTGDKDIRKVFTRQQGGSVAHLWFAFDKLMEVVEGYGDGIAELLVSPELKRAFVFISESAAEHVSSNLTKVQPLNQWRFPKELVVDRPEAIEIEVEDSLREMILISRSSD